MRINYNPITQKRKQTLAPAAEIELPVHTTTSMIFAFKFFYESTSGLKKVPVAELALLPLGHVAQEVVLLVLKYPKQGKQTKGKGSLLLTSSFK